MYSFLCCGVSIYPSASPYTLAKLNNIHHTILHFIFNTFHSSPSVSLIYESSERLLYLCRDLQITREYLRIKVNSLTL